MPKKLERSLLKRAHKLEKNGSLKKENEGAYVYGTLRKTGWKPKTRESKMNVQQRAKKLVEQLIERSEKRSLYRIEFNEHEKGTSFVPTTVLAHDEEDAMSHLTDKQKQHVKSA